MALKPCRECGKQISSEARVCPFCGIRKPVKKKPSAGAMVKNVVEGFLLLLVWQSSAAP